MLGGRELMMRGVQWVLLGKAGGWRLCDEDGCDLSIGSSQCLESSPTPACLACLSLCWVVALLDNSTVVYHKQPVAGRLGLPSQACFSI